MNTPYGSRNLVVATTSLSRREIIVGLGFGGIAAGLAAAGWSVETRAQDTSPVPGDQMTEELNAVVILFGQPADPAAFMNYLVTTHLPLAAQVPGVEEALTLSSLITLEGNPSDYLLIVTLRLPDQEALEAALMSGEAQVTVADLPNFATGGFTVLLAHLRSQSPSPQPSPAA